MAIYMFSFHYIHVYNKYEKEKQEKTMFQKEERKKEI